MTLTCLRLLWSCISAASFFLSAVVLVHLVTGRVVDARLHGHCGPLACRPSPVSSVCELVSVTVEWSGVDGGSGEGGGVGNCRGDLVGGWDARWSSCSIDDVWTGVVFAGDGAIRVEGAGRCERGVDSVTFSVVVSCSDLSVWGDFLPLTNNLTFKSSFSGPKPFRTKQAGRRSTLSWLTIACQQSCRIWDPGANLMSLASILLLIDLRIKATASVVMYQVKLWVTSDY